MTAATKKGPSTVLVSKGKYIPVRDSRLISGAHLDDLIRHMTGANHVAGEARLYVRRHVEDFARAFLLELARIWEEEDVARRAQGKRSSRSKPKLTQRHAEKALLAVLERLKSHPALASPWLTAP